MNILRSLPALLLVLLFACPTAAEDQKTRVLLVTDGNVFISAAVQTFKRYELTTVTQKQLGAIDYADFDVAVIDRIELKATPPISALWIGCVPPKSGITLKKIEGNADKPLDFWSRHLPNPLIKEGKVAAKMFENGVQIRDRHGLSTNGAGMLNTLVSSKEDAVLIAEMFAIEKKHLLVSFDVTQSEWVKRPGWLIFVGLALEHLKTDPELPLERLNRMRNKKGELDWGSNRRRTAMLFQLARTDVGEDFVPELLKMMGEDYSSYYDAAGFFTAEGYSFGNEVDLETGLLLYQECMAKCDALPKDHDEGFPCGLAMTCRIQSAIVASKLGLMSMASRHKHDAEQGIKSVPGGRVGVFPAMYLEERAIYDAIPPYAK